MAAVIGPTCYDPGLGEEIAVLTLDVDGDGIREVAGSGCQGLYVVGFAALPSGAPLEDAAIWFRENVQGTLLAPGDVDGGGGDDILVLMAGRLCTFRGEDLGATERCVDAGALDAALGSDLDEDGFPDVWIAVESAVVALGTGGLVDGEMDELARYEVNDVTLGGVAVEDGSVWALADVPAEWTDALAAIELSEAKGETLRELWGGGWGGEPSEPAWHDVTGDGVEDLVMDGGVFAVFDGAALGGGDLTVCDATWLAYAGGDEVWGLHDVDGDGVVDLLRDVGSSTSDDNHDELWSFDALVGGGEATATWTDPLVWPVDGCDIDGDGTAELVGSWLGGTRFYGDIPPTREIGTIDLDIRACLPDLDGDGGADLLMKDAYPHEDEWAVFLSSQLGAGISLVEADAWATFPRWTLAPAWIGAAPDPLPWSFRDGRLCVIAAADLTEEAIASATPGRCGDEVWNWGATAWLDDVTGDGTDDIVFVARDDDGVWAFRALDGAEFGASWPLATFEEDSSSVDAGAGPPLGGTGARSLWTLSTSATDRPVLRVLVADP